MLKNKIFARRRLLIVGCGDVGLRLLPRVAGRFRVLALTSTPARCPTLRAAGARPLVGNLDDAATLARLAGIADAVVHLAPPPGHGDDDPRTRNLLAVLAHPRWRNRRILPQPGRMPPGSAPVRVVYASTSGVYGDCGGAVVDETRPVAPATARAKRRVAAETRLRQWGKAAAGQAAIRARQVAVLRVPGIYAGDRLPLARLAQRTPALLRSDDVYTNHVHADDLARLIAAALGRARPQRLYHASDDGALRMGDWFDAVADWAGLPRPPRIDRNAAEQQLPAPLLSFMRESRRLSGARRQTELRIALSYPTVQTFLARTPPPATPGVTPDQSS